MCLIWASEALRHVALDPKCYFTRGATPCKPPHRDTPDLPIEGQYPKPRGANPSTVVLHKFVPLPSSFWLILAFWPSFWPFGLLFWSSRPSFWPSGPSFWPSGFHSGPSFWPSGPSFWPLRLHVGLLGLHFGLVGLHFGLLAFHFGLLAFWAFILGFWAFILAFWAFILAFWPLFGLNAIEGGNLWACPKP